MLLYAKRTLRPPPNSSSFEPSQCFSAVDHSGTCQSDSSVGRAARWMAQTIKSLDFRRRQLSTAYYILRLNVSCVRITAIKARRPYRYAGDYNQLLLKSEFALCTLTPATASICKSLIIIVIIQIIIIITATNLR